MFSELQNVLHQGGVILWALLTLAIGVYAMLASTSFGLWQVKKEMRVKSLLQASHGDRRQLVREFAIMELDKLAWVERRLPFIGVLAGAAPLAGLMGTVSGMLVMFSGLAHASEAKPIDRISIGISEALVTTQAGLLIAIPAAIFLAILRSQAASTHASLQQKLHQSLVSLESDNLENNRYYEKI